MITKALALCLIAAAAAAQPVAVQRIRMSETEEAVMYKDKMSDGTYRDSRVVKPKPVYYPERIELVGTNDAPRFYELVYVGYYFDGTVRTNHTPVLKSKRMLAEELLVPPPPVPDVPPPHERTLAKDDALGHAKARLLAPAAAETNAVRRMGPPAPRVKTALLADGKLVETMTDGTVRISAPRRAFTARTDARPHNGNTGAPLGAAAAAGAAALAAAAGYAAGKKRNKDNG